MNSNSLPESSKYTPPPWHAGTGSWVYSEVDGGGLRGYDAVDYYGGYLIAESVADHNKGLVAAAPELLAVVREFLDLQGRRRHPLGQPDEDIAYDAAATAAKAWGLINRLEGHDD